MQATNNASTVAPLTLTVIGLQESVDLDIFWVTFDAKIAYDHAEQLPKGSKWVLASFS